MNPRAAALLALGLAILMLRPPSHLGAQEPARRRVLPELRADVVTGDVVTGQVAAGVHITSGTYFRIALLAGVGAAWDEQERGESYRFEAQGRFHLDPLRTTRFGLYGIGGVMVGHDPFNEWQSRMVVGVGAELPAYARATLAVEAALAGGFRVSVATRRVPLGRR